MNREDLVVALATAGQAAALCRQALLDGADLVMFPGTVSTLELRTMYRRRAEHLRQHHIAAVGADEAADSLERTPHADLVVGRVDGGPGSHVFQLFLDPDAEHVVACLAVPERRGDAVAESNPG